MNRVMPRDAAVYPGHCSHTSLRTLLPNRGQTRSLRDNGHSSYWTLAFFSDMNRSNGDRNETQPRCRCGQAFPLTVSALVVVQSCCWDRLMLQHQRYAVLHFTLTHFRKLAKPLSQINPGYMRALGNICKSEVKASLSQALTLSAINNQLLQSHVEHIYSWCSDVLSSDTK